MTTHPESTEGTTRYRICGLTLASEIPLPELVAVAGSDPVQEPDISFRLEHVAVRRTSRGSGFTVFALPAGEPGLECAREPGGYRLRFPGLADFRVDVRGREFVCEAPEGIPPATIRHLLLDQVIPRALSLRGVYALHATAVLTPHGICAFAGPAGVGKSTLAASFHVAGYPVLSDDCLVLQEGNGTILVTPAYPGVRLWDNAAAALLGNPEGTLPAAGYGSKLRVLEGSHPGSLPPDRRTLARIYNIVDPLENEMEFSAEGRIVETIPDREAFMSLISSVYRLDITDRRLLARQFGFLERVASLVPVRNLRVPEDFSALPTVRDAIFADLRMNSTTRNSALESERRSDETLSVRKAPLASP